MWYAAHIISEFRKGIKGDNIYNESIFILSSSEKDIQNDVAIIVKKLDVTYNKKHSVRKIIVSRNIFGKSDFDIKSNAIEISYNMYYCSSNNLNMLINDEDVKVMYLSSIIEEK